MTRGRAALDAYFRRHADIAAQHGYGVILETPTWRASRDWGARIGYPAAELRHVNQDAVDLLSRVRGGHLGAASSPVVISGCIGPRADAYRPAVRMDEDKAEAYHAGQIDILAATRAGVPAAISFTTETDGRLPDGTSLTNAVAAVDAATGGAGPLRSQLRAPLPLRISPPHRPDRSTRPKRPRERLQEEPHPNWTIRRPWTPATRSS
jgi:homocysteine S-methyltransferase